VFEAIDIRHIDPKLFVRILLRVQHHHGRPQSYRADAARHVYGTYAKQIYKGTLPPLVHAIVVVETEVDQAGNVRDVRVVRSPSHAPEVTRSVVAMIREASPFPEPRQLGATKFLEVWMVDHSGRFQLHTLTEGQR
jgi:protein TonB